MKAIYLLAALLISVPVFAQAQDVRTEAEQQVNKTWMFPGCGINDPECTNYCQFHPADPMCGNGGGTFCQMNPSDCHCAPIPCSISVEEK